MSDRFAIAIQLKDFETDVLRGWSGGGAMKEFLSKMYFFNFYGIEKPVLLSRWAMLNVPKMGLFYYAKFEPYHLYGLSLIGLMGKMPINKL